MKWSDVLLTKRQRMILQRLVRACGGALGPTPLADNRRGYVSLVPVAIEVERMLDEESSRKKPK